MNFKSYCRGAVACGVVALLSACGGGQVDEFKPSRILSFGDEQSLITNTGNGNGLKYSVNLGATTDTTDLECQTYPVWTQIVASEFGHVFAECKSASATATAFMRAVPLAKVANFESQFAGTDPVTFTDKDLATVMIGTYDLLELYGRVYGKTAGLSAALGSNLDTVVTGSALTYDEAVAEAKVRGKQWADLQNRIANTGARVLAVTVPDLSLSPMARADQAAADADATVTDKRQRALLLELVTQYNLAMRLNQIQDGRMIGLVFGEIETQQMEKYPGSYSLSNVRDAVCTTALPNCTTETVIAAAAGKATQWLWADTYRLGTQYQKRMGDLAYYRANNNPF